jgi:glycerophosphoryl diester phosphodiesterase
MAGGGRCSKPTWRRPTTATFSSTIRLAGGIGINGIYNGSIAPNAWNRIAMTRDAAGSIRKYINGTLVGTQSGADSRFQLNPAFYLFTDEDNETQPGYVSSFRFVDSALDDEQIRLLGNVSSLGATVPGPAIPDPPPPPGPPILPVFGRTQIMGHRAGGTLAPENTLAALEVGIAAGIDLIEIDIHLTADGHAVVFHDSTLDRTTNGAGPIANTTLAQVKQLDAGSWFSPQFANERVPTLTEFMQAVDGRARVLLDVKVTANSALRNAIDAAIDASGATLDDIWVWPSSSSYTNDPRFGAAEVQLLDNVPGDLSDSHLQSLKSNGIDGTAVGDGGAVTQEAINAFHRNGMWFDVYTVNDPARMQALISMGVDSIETDRPDLMAELIYAGDFDGDWDVDGGDLLIWQQTLGSMTDHRADANDDGVVGAADLARWKATLGAERAIPLAASATQSPVPEPVAAVLMMIGCAFVTRSFNTAVTGRGPRP